MKTFDLSPSLINRTWLGPLLRFNCSWLPLTFAFLPLDFGLIRSGGATISKLISSWRFPVRSFPLIVSAVPLKLTLFVVKAPQGPACHHRPAPQSIRPVGYWPFRTRNRRAMKEAADLQSAASE